MKNKLNVKIIMIMVLILLIIFPILQNTDVVTLKLFFWEISMSRIILFPLIFIVGFLTGWGVVLYRNYRKKGSKQQL